MWHYTWQLQPISNPKFWQFIAVVGDEGFGPWSRVPGVWEICKTCAKGKNDAKNTTFLEISFRFWSSGKRNGWFRSSAELAFQCLGRQRIEQTDLSKSWVKLLLWGVAPSYNLQVYIGAQFSPVYLRLQFSFSVMLVLFLTLEATDSFVLFQTLCGCLGECSRSTVEAHLEVQSSSSWTNLVTYWCKSAQM